MKVGTGEPVVVLLKGTPVANWPEFSLVELPKYGRVVVVVDVTIGWKVISVVILGDVRKVQREERETDCDFEEIRSESERTVGRGMTESEDEGEVTVM